MLLGEAKKVLQEKLQALLASESYAKAREVLDALAGLGALEKQIDIALCQLGVYDVSGPLAGSPMPEPVRLVVSKGIAMPSSFCLPILEALQALGGAAPRAEVTSHVYEKLKAGLSPADLKMKKSRSGPNIVEFPAWKLRLWTARQELARRGLLGYGRKKTIWKLTKRGAEHLSREVAKSVGPVR